MSTLKTGNITHPSSTGTAITLDASDNVTINGPTNFNSNALSGIASINGGQIGGNRNLVINGAMEVDQRNATTTMGAVTYGLDRFTCYTSHDGVQTMVQSTDAPVGFRNSLKVTTTTADASLAAGQRSSIIYRVEAQDNAHLEFGTANAKTITLSFYVKSSITGTHGGAIGNGNDTRGYPFTYTINTADTWERKTVTVAGDTSGTWATDNGRGINLVWGLGVGSTYSGTAGAWASGDFNSATGATTDVTGTLNATWFLTGVQLETGSQATDFQHENYGTTLQKCQRYYWRQERTSGTNGWVGTASGWSPTEIFTIVRHPTTMRASPSLSYSASNALTGATNLDSRLGSAITSGQPGTDSILIYIDVSGATEGKAYTMYLNNDGNWIACDAEL